MLSNCLLNVCACIHGFVLRSTLGWTVANAKRLWRPSRGWISLASCPTHSTHKGLGMLGHKEHRDTDWRGALGVTEDGIYALISSQYLLLPAQEQTGWKLQCGPGRASKGCPHAYPVREKYFTLQGWSLVGCSFLETDSTPTCTGKTMIWFTWLKVNKYIKQIL